MKKATSLKATSILLPLSILSLIMAISIMFISNNVQF